MARRYHMTRDDAKELVKQLRTKKHPQLIVVATNRVINQFTIISLDELEGNNRPLVLRKAVYHLLQDAGVWEKVKGQDLDEIYDWLPNKAWAIIEDIVYQEANQYLTTISRLGYMPTDKEGRLIENIKKLVVEAVKDKHSPLSKVNKVSIKQLKLTEEEWELYKTSGGSEFKGEDGLERGSQYNSFHTAGLTLKENENVVKEEVLIKGAKYLENSLNRMSKANKTYIEILYEELKGLINIVGRENNEAMLYYFEQSLSQAVYKRVRFESKVKEAISFKEELKNYKHIKTIKPIIHNNTPYILLTGDLNGMYYYVQEGRRHVGNPVSMARGVTELEQDSTGNNLHTYRVTLNAFRDITINDDFDEKYIQYEEGEWDKYYESGSKVGLKLTPAFVREVDANIEFTVVTYNANRTGTNALGMALPFWRTDVIEMGHIYERADVVHEDVLELYEKLDKTSYVAKIVAEWKRGYDIRNGNTENLDLYKGIAQLINKESIKLEPQVVQAVNDQFNTNYKTIKEIRDQDFGFDSGFSYIEYADRGKEEEARALQAHTHEPVEVDKAVTFIPRVQSITIKDFVGHRFIKELNKKLPTEFQLKYYSRLD